MPGAGLAEYGIAIFTVAGLVYIVDRWIKSKNQNEVAEVINNNTKALEQLTILIKVTLARQEEKINELIAHARSGKHGGGGGRC